ncbi:thiopeptide-type bacteriocin biosynthesis protein, partial [Bacillus paranthracis]|uniref:lantibiotic dehydratase n=1 Tax=Bacillus paranthracis TaxID=2026186 RepID=UPI002E1B6DF0|nr:thiopeptide-type bacteriocin biosynthesis protein [Bacillus paranthracis]
SNVKVLYNLTFSPLVGSEEYGKSMGRFNYLLNEVNSSEENEKDKQEEKVEVTFLPDVAHHANVLTFTSKNKYFIEYGTETETEKLNKISLEDIYAFVYKDELKLVHKNTGKIIDACASNMFSIEGYPKELKCLLEISAHQKAHLLTLQMQLIHIINSLKGPCPRITYKNFILVPKSWRLNSERYYINGDFLDEDSFYKMFDKMVDAQNIPQSVFIGPSDQKLLLNIKNKNHRDILYKLFKKNPDLVIYENIFSEDNLLLEGSNGEKFIGEFVFSVRKKEKSLNLMKIDVSKTSFLDFELSKQNSFSPFEEWISIKYYFKEDFQDNIIKDFVKDLYLRLIKKNIISTFFFIRYKDPKSHLRVRMKIKENKYKEFIEIYSSFLQDTNIKHLLTDCIMDTYVQEFARYGGENCISYAEEVFHSDSISCMEMIEMYRNKTLSFSKIELFIISSIKMLDYMGIGLGDQVDYLSNYNAGKKFNEEYNKLSSKLSEIIDGKDNWKHLRLAESGVNLFISISNLEKPCKKYWEIIESECKGYSGNKEYILQSILHMHFNRLVGINRGLETRVMSYLYKFIYTKYSKMKYLNKKGNNEKGVII